MRRCLYTALAALALSLLAGPAQAGEYVVVAVTGGGTVTRTYPNGSSESYSLGAEWPDFSEQLQTGGSSSISYQYQATFEYQWIPSEGYNDDEDPPVTTVQSVDCSPTLAWIGSSSQEFDPGSAGGSWSLTAGSSSSPSWEASMVSTPDGMGSHSEFPTGFWGTQPFSLPFTLSGDSPTLTVTFQGNISMGGVLGGMLALTASIPRKSSQEQIWHYSPTRNTRLKTLGTTVTPIVGWTGTAGNWYKIFTDIADPLGVHNTFIDDPTGQNFNFLTWWLGPYQSGGGKHSVSLTSFTPSRTGKYWTSYAELWHWDNVTGTPTYTGKNTHAGYEVIAGP